MSRTTALALPGLLALWEVAGRLALVADGALPAPSAILFRAWTDRSDLAGHAAATLHASAVGFAAGVAVAVLAAVAFVRWPPLGRAFHGVNVALFALPPIALAPILVIAFEGMTPRYVLAAVSVYFPTMTAMALGLSLADPRAVDVVRAYGGGAGAVMRLVRLRGAVPALIGGLQTAAPNAVLGAILAEFGSGARWGLGGYLVGSLGRADPARLWAIGLTATAMAGLAYAVFALIGRRAADGARAVTIAPQRPPVVGRIGWPMTLVALILPFLLWQAALWLLGAPALVAKGPLDVADYLLLGPTAERAQDRLLTALAETAPITLAGLAAGLALALGLAALGQLAPALARALLPVALVTQTMPLVALTPLLVLLLGRGEAVTLAVTMSVTFFPAYVTVAQGLAMTPRAAFDLVDAYGAGRLTRLRLIGLPAAGPHLLTAARLAAPRALLGVMIAEWLATGRGLGGLMNQSRGMLDYGMIWSVALVSILVAVALHAAVGALERGAPR
ncbi:ABC transporter permease [Rubrimonas cliftonensis]|uniref:ABC-type nitrate/sulfonate/bicarbonate transport system, permease component n=1 Tax=Rubrimonas cliftonensis TaxID=89524 RepID=A0A1H4DJZ5_9RHOB|nr:ABC transporter permease subunit [Rubrimonas cliftonensis]SEA73065.1 ABC-type nitrate/sulfonate/bicarbonate transport system, permease component [Rubrimonas cliftonensis]